MINFQRKECANGSSSFLLARLHLDSLVGMRAPKAIRIALKKLPHGSNAYDSAYEEAMQRILGQVPSSRELAEQTLAWISRAKRQLSVSELQYALAVEVGESELDEENISQVADILSVCAGLVTVDEESRIIRLVHYTTQEYFQRKRQVWFRDPEADITQICVTYLLFQSGPCLTRKEFEERLTLNPFYDYAARNWGHHARESSVLSSEVNDFLNCKVKIEASSQAIEDRAWDLLKDPQTTGLHLATYFGLEEAVKSMLEHGADIDSRDSYGGTSLLWAARYGRETVVNLLIERNAHLEMKDRFGQTPLSRAAGSDNKRVAELLLENGADLESKDKYGRSPLSTAARDGNETAVKLLLEKGADLQSKDRYDLTPLSWAARYGFEAVVQLLLDGGAILDSIDHFGRTPLSWAVESGYGAVVEVLLDKGADLNLKDHSGRTPLSWITEDECKAVLKLLLDRKADLESRDDSGRTPLSWAAENTSEAVVEELLDNGAELESEDHAGRTPLWWAARWANMTVVERLLEKGALMHDDETKVAVSECLEYGNYNES